MKNQGIERILRRAWVACALAAAATGCAGRAAPAGTVRVAAASDLRFALDELSAAFSAAHHGVTLAISYGSSGGFFAQLLNRAPYDVFLSADVEYPRQLAARGLTLRGSEFTYAFGRIVLWTRTSSPLDIVHDGLSALTDERAGHVAIANPEHAPYGRAAIAALRSAGVYDAVAPKLVFGETVTQAMQFVQSGSADAGIVALSLALSPPVARDGRFVQIPEGSYPRIEQGGAILEWAIDRDAANLFRSFMLSDDARAVLKRYGFAPPAA